MRRRVVIGVLAGVALLGLPGSALAHAQLEGTSPARGAVLEVQPGQVVFRFGESVEGNFGAVRVFDARGARVDDNRVFHPGGRGSQIAVGLRAGLARGTYTATYRVISADSHPVSGGLVFSVGSASAGAGETVSQLLAGTSTGPITDTAFGVARGLDYLAIALALGGLAFLLVAWRPALAAAAGAGESWTQASDAFAARARRVLWLAVALGVLSGAAGIVLQGATAAGTTFFSALDPSVVREVLGTRFGTVWGARILAWLLLGGVLGAGGAHRTVAVLRPAAVGADGVAPSPAPGRLTLAGLAVPAAFLAISPALGGHATTQHPVAALAPLDVVHVLAMSAWIGGLIMLLFVVPAATRRLEPAQRSALLGAVLGRFSKLALGCVLALAATGATMALIEMGGLSPLLSTAFGRSVLIKAALLAALIALGAVNRRRVVPTIKRLAAAAQAPGAAGRLLRATLRAEVALVIAVLGVTSALVSYAPPTSASSGPFSTTTRMGPIELEMTIDPAKVGANQLHAYLFDARTGAPYTNTKQLDLQAALPSKHIGPLPTTMRKAGPGHYIADTLQLLPAGTWKLTLTDRINDFDQYTKTIKVPVR